MIIILVFKRRIESVNYKNKIKNIENLGALRKCSVTRMIVKLPYATGAQTY